MKLYVLKCDGGYVRNMDLNKCKCVPIEKASVFNEKNLPEAKALMKCAKREGLNNVRVVELIVTEGAEIEI